MFFLFLLIGLFFILLAGGYAEEQEKEQRLELRKADRRRNARFAEEFSREAENTAYIHK